MYTHTAVCTHRKFEINPQMKVFFSFDIIIVITYTVGNLLCVGIQSVLCTDVFIEIFNGSSQKFKKTKQR